MSFTELKGMLDEIPAIYREEQKLIPIVLIGHPKNLPEYSNIEKFLRYVNSKNIEVTTFKHILPHIM